MRILVTGGAGYVGSVVTQQCVKAGHEVTVLDNLVQGHRGTLTPGAELIVGDVGDEALVMDLLSSRRIDAVCHLAAATVVARSFIEPAFFYDQNLVRGLSMLNSMVSCGVKRMVFSSTASVFGEPVQIPIDETHPLEPISPYGESKLMFERLLARYAQIFGLQYATFRYFNACGASGPLGEHHQPESHIIPLMFRAASGQSGPFHVYGKDYDTPDGTPIRDYVHVIDLASAHLMALEKLGSFPSQGFNLGSGAGVSVLELIEATGKIIGRPVPYEIRGRRPGDPRVLRACSARATSVLGWQPIHSSIEQIVRSAWEWHQEHPSGYEE